MTPLSLLLRQCGFARDQPFSQYCIAPFPVIQNGFLRLLVEPFQLAFVACGQPVESLLSHVFNNFNCPQ
jgi:hypothetical protein